MRIVRLDRPTIAQVRDGRYVLFTVGDTPSWYDRLRRTIHIFDAFEAGYDACVSPDHRRVVRGSVTYVVDTDTTYVCSHLIEFDRKGCPPAMAGYLVCDPVPTMPETTRSDVIGALRRLDNPISRAAAIMRLMDESDKPDIATVLNNYEYCGRRDAWIIYYTLCCQ